MLGADFESAGRLLDFLHKFISDFSKLSVESSFSADEGEYLEKYSFVFCVERAASDSNLYEIADYLSGLEHKFFLGFYF